MGEDFSRAGRSGMSVAASASVPPGPIPNPVVTRRSAGEYCRGDPVGGEAVAGIPDWQVRSIQPVPSPLAHTNPKHTTKYDTQPSTTRRGVEQWQLVGLITQRSGVRIPPPLPTQHEAIGPIATLRSGRLAFKASEVAVALSLR
jgi:hypothetical protein